MASSGLDSLLDVFMSAMNFWAIRKAAQPPDDSHPYGHGKAENLAAVFQAVGGTIFTGSWIIYQAGQKYLLETAIRYSRLDLGVDDPLAGLQFFYLPGARPRGSENRFQRPPGRCPPLYQRS